MHERDVYGNDEVGINRKEKVEKKYRGGMRKTDED